MKERSQQLQHGVVIQMVPGYQPDAGMSTGEKLTFRFDPATGQIKVRGCLVSTHRHGITVTRNEGNSYTMTYALADIVWMRARSWRTDGLETLLYQSRRNK